MTPREIIAKYMDHEFGANADHEADDFLSYLRSAGYGIEPDWQPIETAKQNQNVLVAYQNGLGKWRVVRACYHTQLEWSDDHWRDDDDESEYAPEGWYEESETSETIYPLEYKPTHWRPLPAPPAIRALAKEKQGC